MKFSNLESTTILKPTNLSAFKRMWGIGRNKRLLLPFLQGVLNNKLSSPIEQVVLLKPVLDTDAAHLRQSVVEVLCRDARGDKYVVQLGVVDFYLPLIIKNARTYAEQAFVPDPLDPTFDHLKGVIFTGLIANQIFADQKWTKNEKVFFYEPNAAVSSFHRMEFIFVNLDPFKTHLPASLKHLPIDQQVYFFLAKGESVSEKEINQLCNAHPIFYRLYEELNPLCWNEVELASYQEDEARDYFRVSLMNNLQLKARPDDAHLCQERSNHQYKEKDPLRRRSAFEWEQSNNLGKPPISIKKYSSLSCL